MQALLLIEDEATRHSGRRAYLGRDTSARVRKSVRPHGKKFHALLLVPRDTCRRLLDTRTIHRPRAHERDILRYEMSLPVIYKCICAKFLSVCCGPRSKKEENAPQSNTAQISPPRSGSAMGRSLAAIHGWRVLGQVTLTILVCVCFRSIFHYDGCAHHKIGRSSPVRAMLATDDHEALLQLPPPERTRSAWHKPWRRDM